MKTLFILRHAEAAPAAEDFSRSLTAKGIRDMQAMTSRLGECDLRPDFVLCSPAKRTRMTLENLLPGVQAEFPEAMYNGSAGTHYEFLKRGNDGFRSVMIIAHNPGIFNLTRFLAAPGPDVPKDYVPGTLTIFECAIERWAGLMPGVNRIVRVLAP